MIDLDELRKKAEAATNGPWEVCKSGGEIFELGPISAMSYYDNPPYLEVTEDDASFIAAANPSVVLELIDRVEKAEAQLYGTTRDDEGKPAIGEPSYAHQWALDTLSGAENGRRFIWGQRNLAKSYLNMEAEISRLRTLLVRAGEALKPFHLLAPGEARDWTDEHGWTDRAPKNERICDWFGPTDFHIARTIAVEIEKEIGNG